MLSKTVVTVEMLKQLNSCYTSDDATNKQRALIITLQERGGAPLSAIVASDDVPLEDVAWLILHIHPLRAALWLLCCIQRVLRDIEATADKGCFVTTIRLLIVRRHVTLLVRQLVERKPREACDTKDINVGRRTRLEASLHSDVIGDATPSTRLGELCVITCDAARLVDSAVNYCALQDNEADSYRRPHFMDLMIENSQDAFSRIKRMGEKNTAECRALLLSLLETEEIDGK